MALTEAISEEPDFLDPCSIIGTYGGPNGLSFDQIVAALDPLNEILTTSPDAFTRLVPALADNLLINAYRTTLGRMPTRTTLDPSELPLETRVLLTQTQNGGPEMPRTPSEAALHFLPLPYAQRLVEIYGTQEGRTGLSPEQLTTAVVPLLPFIEKPRIKTFLGVIAEGLIRRNYYAKIGTLPQPIPAPISRRLH